MTRPRRDSKLEQSGFGGLTVLLDRIGMMKMTLKDRRTISGGQTGLGANGIKMMMAVRRTGQAKTGSRTGGRTHGTLKTKTCILMRHQLIRRKHSCQRPSPLPTRRTEPSRKPVRQSAKCGWLGGITLLSRALARGRRRQDRSRVHHRPRVDRRPIMDHASSAECQDTAINSVRTDLHQRANHLELAKVQKGRAASKERAMARVSPGKVPSRPRARPISCRECWHSGMNTPHMVEHQPGRFWTLGRLRTRSGLTHCMTWWFTVISNTQFAKRIYQPSDLATDTAIRQSAEQTWLGPHWEPSHSMCWEEWPKQHRHSLEQEHFAANMQFCHIKMVESSFMMVTLIQYRHNRQVVQCRCKPYSQDISRLIWLRLQSMPWSGLQPRRRQSQPRKPIEWSLKC